MKITLITIGKTDKDYLIKGMDIYLKRLRHYINFEIDIIPDIKNTKNLSEAQQKQKEGELILAKANSVDQLILLDEKGILYSSEEFAGFIEKKMVVGTKHLAFVIGGPYGFSEDVYSKASGKVSLSAMTFSHQMVRLIFVEQLYRAMTIIKGEPYHHK